MFIGKKYYWVPILVKIEQLEKEDKRLKRDMISLDKYTYEIVDELKEKIKGLELRVAELEPKYEVEFKTIKGDK